RSSTMTTARPGAVCFRPSVSDTETTATTLRPSSLVPATVPDSTFHAKAAFLPVSPVSALAKQEPAKTSQVRASTYWPRTVADGSADNRAGRSNRQDMGSPPSRVPGSDYLVILLSERPRASSEHARDVGRRVSKRP